MWQWSVAIAADLAGCEQRLAEAPGAREAVTCFYDLARETGDYDRSTETIASLVEQHPDWPWASFTLANLLTDQGRVAEAIPRYEAAILGFDAAGDRPGRVLGRLNLVTYLADDLRFDDCERLLDEAAALAEGDPGLTARARAQRGRIRWRSGVHLGAAEVELRALLDELGEGGEYQTRLIVLHTLQGIAQSTGQREAAAFWLEEMEDHTRSAGDTYVRATVGAQRLQLAMEAPFDDPSGVRALAEASLRLAEAGGNPYAAMEGRCALAWVGEWPGNRPAWDACLAAVDADGDPEQGPYWRTHLVDRVAGVDPAFAAQVLDDAERQVADWALDGLRPGLAIRRARLAAAAGRNDEAWAHTRSALERLRAQAVSSDPSTRASALVREADLLYEPAERLARTPEGQERALLLTEAFRGALHDGSALAARDAAPDAQQVSLRRALDAALARLWDVEGRERDAVLAEIARLRADAAERDHAAWASRGGAPSSRPPPTFADLQAALLPDEALVSVQLPQSVGPVGDLPPAWAWVVTVGGVQRIEVPPRWVLEPQVRGLVAAARARDGSEQGPDAAFARGLLDPVLAALPPGVRRLWWIPDGPLHALPLGWLPGPDGAPLEARYPVTVAPSARHLVAARSAPRRAPSASVVFAAPAGPDRVALPAAAREAEAVIAAVPGRIHSAEAATEAELVAALQDPSVGLVHVAAHAMVDPAHPERSRIQLAGDDALTAGEIASLRVPGTVVVLSACATAAGRELVGEGPMGLSRALLDAGAGAVVATAWPMRDKDAGAFFEAFYAAMGEGNDVGEAVARARAVRRAAGAPAEAWAGVTVMGDARWAPEPRRERRGWVFAGALGAAAALALGVRLGRGQLPEP